MSSRKTDCQGWSERTCVLHRALTSRMDVQKAHIGVDGQGSANVWPCSVDENCTSWSMLSTDFMHLVLFRRGWQGGVLRNRGSFLTTMRAAFSGIDSKPSNLGKEESMKKARENKSNMQGKTCAHTNMHFCTTEYTLTHFQYEKTENHVCWPPSCCWLLMRCLTDVCYWHQGLV